MSQTNYNDYFAHYINLVNSENVIEAIETTAEEFLGILKLIPKEKENYRYAEGKWSIKELVSHVIDSERIFAYRAMRFARNDQANLAGFDENDYVKVSNANARSFKDLTSEFSLVRQGSIALFNSFNDEMMNRSGSANGIKIDVTALGYLIGGHCRHHGNILKERYGI